MIFAKKMVLPEFAWMGKKATDLARASYSTKEHIRTMVAVFQ